MFIAKTDKIKKIVEKNPKRIAELEKIFSKNTKVYIDFANVIPWQDKLGWKVDIKRLRQFFGCFQNIKEIKLYYGTLEGDEKSEELIKDLGKLYKLTTKPVKIIRKSVDVSSIKENNPSILENFVRKSLLKKLNLETITFLNKKLSELNNQGINFIEDRKCNFDVEMGVDILLDLEKGNTDHYVIWSGDSDFESVINSLSSKNKKIYIFGVPGRISFELNKSKAWVYDIKKIRNFICYNNQIQAGLLQ